MQKNYPMVLVLLLILFTVAMAACSSGPKNKIQITCGSQTDTISLDKTYTSPTCEGDITFTLVDGKGPFYITTSNDPQWKMEINPSTPSIMIPGDVSYVVARAR